MSIVDEIINPSFQAENTTRTLRSKIINLFQDIDTTTNMKGYTALLSKKFRSQGVEFMTDSKASKAFNDFQITARR